MDIEADSTDYLSSPSTSRSNSISGQTPETMEALKATRDLVPDSKSAQKLAQVVEAGSECAVQTLYEGPSKCKCCKNWVESYPDDLKSAIERQAETQAKALVVRMAKSHEEGDPLMLHSVVVQSPLIKALLSKAFQGFEGITANLKKLVFRSPFHPFYYRWETFTDLVNQQCESGDEAAPFSKLLYDIIESQLRDTKSEIEDLRKNGVITFQTLWALFAPGTRVYSFQNDHHHYFLLKKNQYKKFEGVVYFCLEVNYIDWDGKQFGYNSDILLIPEFTGTRAITDLSVYPADLHESKHEVEGAVIARGKRFQELGEDFSYKSYSGMIQFQRKKQIVTRHVDGRIVVDASAYFQQNPTENIRLIPLSKFSLAPEVEVHDDKHRPRYPAIPDYMPDYGYDNPRDPISQKLRAKGKIGNKDMHPRATLSDDELLLCSSHVRGYCLKHKVMALFSVDNVGEISWNDDAFPSLMLPPGYRDLILTFIKNQAENKILFDDVIEGKGQGLIMLLTGNPGTGKTLTAEAVADKVRKPLYLLSAGELGRDASDVEDRLTSVLDITQKWNAVLLLDECDIFLEERSANNLDHNEIVAVFLRMLEYYPGILFLTSNRATSIDPAFQSRIHLTLQYPDLDNVARKHIWKQFAIRSNLETSLTEEQYDWLSSQPLNGRQVKNIIKTSLLLAGDSGKTLAWEHIETVLRATKEINTAGFAK